MWLFFVGYHFEMYDSVHLLETWNFSSFLLSNFLFFQKLRLKSFLCLNFFLLLNFSFLTTVLLPTIINCHIYLDLFGVCFTYHKACPLQSVLNGETGTRRFRRGARTLDAVERIPQVDVGLIVVIMGFKLEKPLKEELVVPKTVSNSNGRP